MVFLQVVVVEEEGGRGGNVILFDQTKDPIYKLNEGFRWQAVFVERRLCL